MKQLGFSVVCLCVWERDRGVTKQGFNSKHFCGGVSSSGEEFAEEKMSTPKTAHDTKMLIHIVLYLPYQSVIYTYSNVVAYIDS